ncbi:MAG: DoxX family membrane protein, partial [Verrucomicrobia bacterium]|nr:DoxX family membrane protein [Verrucomicrobiota bacterium]
MTSKFEQCQQWVETHRNVLFDCVRVYLGVGLFIKGIYFFMHPELFAQFTNAAANSWLVTMARAVPYVHMVGGLLLALGVLTWLAALVQLPVLIGAVFFVNLPHMIDTEGREAVEFSALVLFLVFLIFLRSFLPGANPLSILQLRKGPAALGAGAKSPGGYDDVFVDLIRIYLGIGLLIKGVYFMEHREHLVKLLEESGSWVIVPVIAMHYVVPAHFAGGLL